MLPEKRRDLLIVAITQVIAYIFLFLIAPYILKDADDIYRFSFRIFCVIIIYLISFVKYPVKFLSLFWGIPIIWGLIMLYSGDLYGIIKSNFSGLNFFEFTAAIFAIKLFLIQCAIKAVLFIGKFIKKKVFPM